MTEPTGLNVISPPTPVAEKGITTSEYHMAWLTGPVGTALTLVTHVLAPVVPIWLPGALVGLGHLAYILGRSLRKQGTTQ